MNNVKKQLLNGSKRIAFYAFGADRSSSWYRLSVGTCRKADITPMFDRLEAALAKLQ